MAFIIWYQLTFPKAGLLGLAPLRVSNDVFSGDYILDADIRLTMSAGDTADRFSIRLTNLPDGVVKDLVKKQSEGLPRSPLEVRIALGYFEDAPLLQAPDPVMVGAVTSLESEVNAAGMLVTKIEGQEIAGYRLLNSGPINKPFPGDATPVMLARFIEETTKVTLGTPPPAADALRDYTLVAEHGLAALRVIANIPKPPAPLLIRDNAIHMSASAASTLEVVTLSPDVNLVSHAKGQSIDTARGARQRSEGAAPEATARQRCTVVVLGHPGLRIGQEVTLEIPGETAGPWYIVHLIHNFSTSEGYTCEAVLSSEAPGGVSDASAGADALVERFRDLAEATQAHQVAIDVGEVQAYEPGQQQKHLATLNYGQTPAAGVVAPSVETPVEDDAQLHRKPIASPFAWHKCGLITPVYPGMRALLAHNQGSANDAVVAGFLWAENPADARPRNAPGDYWLCLPTELDGSSRPTGKGVNDLTDASGVRVIQARGLRIAVGPDLLPAVGERPEVPADLAGTVVLEHQSGARITISSDGAIAIEANNQPITLSTGAGPALKVTSTGVEVA